MTRRSLQRIILEDELPKLYATLDEIKQRIENTEKAINAMQTPEISYIILDNHIIVASTYTRLIEYELNGETHTVENTSDENPFIVIIKI